MKYLQKLINPRKTWTSVHNSRIGYFWTLVTLTGFIETLFSNTTRSRYSICSFQNLYFFGQRHSLCSIRISSTLQIVLVYYLTVLVKIRILSKYTTTISSIMRSQNILFIIVQKIAGLLVMLQNYIRITTIISPRLITSRWQKK